MYAMTMHITSPDTTLYAELAEMYRLPPLLTLVAALEVDQEWRQYDPSVQGYYLDNLREQNRRHLFQVRFSTSKQSREYTDAYLSIKEDGAIHQLSLHFPAKGDRQCHSYLLGWLKGMLKDGQAVPEFEIAGFGERDSLRFIREHSLSAFRWQEQLRRYLHVTDDPQSVKEVKKGMV